MRSIPIVLIIFLSIFICCNKEKVNESDKIAADYEIAVNDSFQIELVANHTTGYAWVWTNREGVNITDTIDYEYIIDHPDTAGSGGKEIWKFKGIKTGLDSVKFEYKRSWDPNSTIDSKNIVVRVK
jgi:predicted secreted protein